MYGVHQIFNITISVDFRVDWASFELIVGDFYSHSFGENVKRNDSIVREELKYSKFSLGVEVDFQELGDCTYRVSDYEELVGVIHKR